MYKVGSSHIEFSRVGFCPDTPRILQLLLLLEKALRTELKKHLYILR